MSDVLTVTLLLVVGCW